MRRLLLSSILFVFVMTGFVSADDKKELFRAIGKRDIQTVENLLGNGVDINIRDRAGRTPLCAAASAANPQIMDFLLERGADVNVKDHSGATPLHLAAFERSTDMVRMLLDAGADIEARNGRGLTPLNEANRGGGSNLAVVKLLLENGADVNTRCDQLGQTPLHRAAQKSGIIEDEREAIRQLLEYGADPDARDKEGNTPLDIAEEKNRTEIVAILEGAGK